MVDLLEQFPGGGVVFHFESDAGGVEANDLLFVFGAGGFVEFLPGNEGCLPVGVVDIEECLGVAHLVGDFGGVEMVGFLEVVDDGRVDLEWGVEAVVDEVRAEGHE